MKDLHNIEKSFLKHEEISEISKKKDVNLKNNSSLYFQIGLILCLLGTYGLFEMNFKSTMHDVAINKPWEEPPMIYVVAPKPIPKDDVKQNVTHKRIAVLADKPPIIVDNNNPIEPIDIIVPESFPNDLPRTPVVSNPNTSVIPLNKPFNMKDVEKVPIFPGCESAKNNAERMACMSEKLTKLIQKKFNTDLAAELGLAGIQKIQVQFTIDNRGHVTEIKTRSPYSQLEKEAARVVSKIPVMTPGMQRDTPVAVVYLLPIAFQVH
ncbi:MAG: energy transducer TonB [Aquaticitalea sp.]